MARNVFFFPNDPDFGTDPAMFPPEVTMKVAGYRYQQRWNRVSPITQSDRIHRFHLPRLADF